MALPRDFKETVAARSRNDPALRRPFVRRPSPYSSMASRNRPSGSCAISSTPPWVSRHWPWKFKSQPRAYIGCCRGLEIRL